MQTVTLGTIVDSITPELYPILTERERNAEIVLRDGMQSLDRFDVLEIVAATIHEKRDVLFH